MLFLLRLLLSTPFSILSYLLLWFVPQGSAALTLIWSLTTTCLFETLMSVRQRYRILSLHLRDSANFQV